MKTRAALVCLCAVAAFAMSAGCKPQSFVTTLQGTVFNAITGERIGGDVVMLLVQGDKVRTPDVFYTGEQTIGNPNSAYLKGDYVFTNIPSMENLTAAPADPHSNEYRMTVIADGYQRFEGIIDEDMLANRDNVIRNIYLFPLDYELPCYNFTVRYNGKPVPDVMVFAAPYVTLSPGIIMTDKWLSIGLDEPLDELGGIGDIVSSFSNVFALFNGHYFFPAPGYLASLQDTTDANGVASFCEDVAAGGAYLVLTYPTEFEGVELLPSASIMVPGITPPDLVITARTLVGEAPYGLYYTSASSKVLSSVATDGSLTITFNIPVSLSGDFAVAFQGAYAGTGVLDGADPVTETLSTDGKTLTLTPNFTTAPDSTETNVFMDFTDGTARLSVVGYDGSEIALFSSGDICDANGSNCLSSPTTVQIRP